jgi:hypothetical protein
MKKVLSVLVAVGLIMMFAQFSWAQEQKAAPAKDTSKPGGAVVETTTITATVDAIDAAGRNVTLKFPDGKMKIVKAGPEVRNFDQIQVGDQVKATYAESVAMFVRKSDEKPSAAEAKAVKVAPKGAKPGVLMVNTTEVTAKVEAIDYKKRTVTLKGPEGNVRTLTVDKSVKRFGNVKVGDELVVRVTDALAIVVEKP